MNRHRRAEKRYRKAKHALLLLENEDWQTPFPHPAEGDVCWVVYRFVDVFADVRATEVHYFKREKAARHVLSRYDDAKLTRLVFINGGWVSAPERETGG